jgi:hypothetical protein
MNGFYICYCFKYFDLIVNHVKYKNYLPIQNSGLTPLQMVHPHPEYLLPDNNLILYCMKDYYN